MQINQLKSKTKSKKRVARGGKRGVYSGQGLKGQNSRAGARKQPLIRQLLKRYHKLRGYRFSTVSEDVVSVNLSIIEKNFDEKMVLSPLSLVKSKILDRINNRVPKVKILGTGELTKKIRVSGCLVSKTAKEKIEKAGGSVITEKTKTLSKKTKTAIAKKAKKAEPKKEVVKPKKK